MKPPPRPGEERRKGPGRRPRSEPGRVPARIPAAAERPRGARRLPAPRRPLPAFVRPAFPELLAPAGSPEAYFAAADAGADAVYLGLDRFNARERAENFRLADLCRVLPHARSRGIRIYVAMNTLLTESDLPEAIALLHQLEPLAPDAVIAADLGVLRILREFFPRIPVHVSTQAGCASADAAEEYARMGASRVILERHLKMEEVARIAARSPIGVEIFVHGSMCYSYSGKCFFSSYLGGKSGNRGACVQPCRRLYGRGAEEEPEAVFSTRDLSLLPRLPEIVPLGISALKIEGRMRGAEYVFGVVSAYRAALDGIRAGKPGEAVAEGMRILEGVVGRETTAGLTGGAAPSDVAAGGASGNVGELVGTVARVEDGWAFVPGGAPVSAGDRLRVQFREEGSGKGFSASSLRVSGDDLHVKVPFPLSPGDLLFRVAGAGRGEFTRRARRERETLAPDGARFLVTVSRGAVTVDASYGDVSREYQYRVSGPAGGPPGAVPPDGERQLAGAYRGDLPLAAVKVTFRGGPSAWGDVRALFLQAARQFDKEFHLAGKRLRLEILPALRVSGNRPEEGPGTVIFAGCRPEQLQDLPRVPEVVPVVEFTRALARDPSPVARYARSGAFFRLPVPLLEADAAFLRRTVTEAVRKGFTRWVVPDAGYFRIFAPAPLRRQVTLVSDHYLYAFNMASLSALSRMGAARMILPAEATLSALRDVGKFLYGLGIGFAYGRVPLMMSRLLPASGIRDGEVESARAERFRVAADAHGSAIFPEAPFSASGLLHELRSAGIRDFYADVRDLPAPEVREVLSSLAADRSIQGTSTFNLFRGNF